MIKGMTCGICGKPIDKARQSVGCELCEECAKKEPDNILNKQEKPCACPHAQAVAERIRTRADHGMKKYGVNCARTDLTTLQWLRHAQDEAMDFCVYLERLISDEEKKANDEKAVAAKAT